MAQYLVLGGAGGVGSAVVDTLIKRGDAVSVTVLNDAEAARVKDRYDGAVPAYIVDLANAEDALSSLKSIVSGLERLDAVAICAAIAPIGPLELTPLSTIRRTYEINAVSAIATFQAAMPALRESKGRMVIITSMSGKLAMPFIGAYTGSKYGMEGLADVMRREVAHQGVKISVVEPGGIRTPMVDEQLDTVMTLQGQLDDEERERYGFLYEGFNRLASESHRSTASSAEQVAAVVTEALDADDPEPRYIAGDDARQFIGMATSMSDREFDGFFAQAFGPVTA